MADGTTNPKVLGTLKVFHKKYPMKPGMPKEELRGAFPGITARVFGALLSSVREVAVEKDLVRSAGFRVALSQTDEAGKQRVLDIFRKGRFQPPFVKELSAELSLPERAVSDLLRHMSREGSLTRINDAIYLETEHYEEMIQRLRTHFSGKPEMTVAEFRDLVETSRKYALPFLEFLDSTRVTLRAGDVRKLLLK